MIDREGLVGSVDLVGVNGDRMSSEACADVLAQRGVHPLLAPNASLPDDTRLWAALQRASGGTWGGCVYDVDEIIQRLEAK